MMLKTIHIPGYGPFVFGYKKGESIPVNEFVLDRTTLLNSDPPLHVIDAIVDAAKSLHPIYAAEENVLANDMYGDCTCAGVLHSVCILQAKAGGDWRSPTAADAIWLYSKVTNPPFDPATGDNDNGADLLPVLQFWQREGAYSDGAGKIKSFALVDASSPEALRGALSKNGVLYLGGGLPDAWLPTQTSDPNVWDVDGDSNPQNGHCIAGFGCNDNGVRVNTWGEFKIVTWAAMAQYFSGDAGETYTVELA